MKHNQLMSNQTRYCQAGSVAASSYGVGARLALQSVPQRPSTLRIHRHLSGLRWCSDPGHRGGTRHPAGTSLWGPSLSYMFVSFCVISRGFPHLFLHSFFPLAFPSCYFLSSCSLFISLPFHVSVYHSLRSLSLALFHCAICFITFPFLHFILFHFFLLPILL